MRNESNIKLAKKQAPHVYKTISNDPKWHPHNMTQNGVVILERFLRNIRHRIDLGVAANVGGCIFRHKDLQELLSVIQQWQDKYNKLSKYCQKLIAKNNTLEFQIKLLKERIPKEHPKKSRIEYALEMHYHGVMSKKELEEELSDFVTTKTMKQRAAERKKCA